MNRGYLVQCVPLVAQDRDNGQTGVAAPVGMDFTGEADRAPAPLHYLMNEQAKSLAALQELQNEVGALLEFRDLVIETFPHLRVKMASHTNSPGSSHSTGGSHIPVPLCTSGRREWEPGVRVRRKLPSKETAHDTSLTSAGRSRSNSHGSGSKVQTSQLLSGSGAGGSGASSAGSSAVQDSGFGTESKEHYSASSSASAGAVPASQATSGTRPANNSSEDELWNLLDVIHRKGSRLRQEVEQLQTRLQDKEVAALERSRGRDRRYPTTHRARSLGSATQSQTPRDRPLSAELEHVDNGNDSIDVDAELVASRARASHLRASHLRAEVATARRDLQELLQHEHQGAGVGGRRAAIQLVSPAGSSQLLRPTACFTPVNPLRGSQKPVQVLSEMCVGAPGTGPGSGPSSGGATVRRTSFRDSVFHAVRSESCGSDGASESDSGVTKRRIGRLDGVLTRPADIPLYVRSGAKTDPTQVAAILRETDRIELRRHLLTSMAENSALRQQTEREQRARQGLASQLDSAREENDELRFQLEERSIELEGTRARVRLLERMQSVLSSPASATSAMSAVSTGALVSADPIPPANPTPGLAVEEQTVLGHSSSTESAHDAEVPSPPQPTACPSLVLPGTPAPTQTPKPAPAPTPALPPTDQAPSKAPLSPRRRPSKIPLGTKSYYAPKPPKLQSTTPTPHTSIASHSGSAAGATLKRRSVSTPDSGAPSAVSWRARRDSSGRASAASTQHGSRESLSAVSGTRSRSTPAKSTDASLASANASGSLNRRDLSKSRDSVHSSPGGRKLHAVQTRRGSAGAGSSAGTLKEDPTKGRTKLNFWTGWWKIGILDSPS